MLLALKESLEVELAGGGSDLLSLVGPAFIALTAIFAAWLAAHTANRRQREQLRHDREMRDRDELRITLDSAMGNSSDCINALSRYAVVAQVAEARRAQLEAAREADDSDPEVVSGLTETLIELRRELSEAKKAVHAVLLEMIGHEQRLKLRLADDNPVVSRHQALSSALSDWELALAYADNRSSEQIEAESGARGTTSAAFAQFMESCQRWFAGNPSSMAAP